MREMILNRMSTSAPAGNRGLVVDWLKGMVAGMAQVVRAGVAQTSLRMRWSLHNTPSFPLPFLQGAILETISGVESELTRTHSPPHSRSRKSDQGRIEMPSTTLGAGSIATRK